MKAHPKKAHPKKAESKETDPNKAIYEKRPWLKFYLKEVPKDVKIPEKSAVETFDEATTNILRQEDKLPRTKRPRR
jgi:hypothetical protein